MRLLAILILGVGAVHAQELSWPDFSAQVLDRSPDVRVAEAKVREARAKKLAAFSAFEPKIGLSSEGKQYGGDLQYRLDQAEARIGLPGGIDLVGGALQSTGAFINPERKTPTEGLMQLGISAPLGGAIIWSDRQYQLTAAQRDLEQAEAYLDRVSRKTQLEALKIYTHWQAQADIQRAVDEAQAVAQERLRLVRGAFLLGERSEMDTLEAYLSWVDRAADAAKQQNLTASIRAQVQQAMLGADSAGSSNLYKLVRPSATLVLWVDASAPALQVIGVPEQVVANAEVRKQRMATTTAWAQWLPAPYVDYRALQWGGSAWNTESVQWKVGMVVPLFNQKARSELAGARARLSAAEATLWAVNNQISIAQVQLGEQVSALAKEWKALQSSEQAAYALLQQERRRFAVGESTMFLLAMRETKYLESVQKRSMALAKLQAMEAERRLLVQPTL